MGLIVIVANGTTNIVTVGPSLVVDLYCDTIIPLWKNQR